MRDGSQLQRTPGGLQLALPSLRVVGREGGRDVPGRRERLRERGGILDRLTAAPGEIRQHPAACVPEKRNSPCGPPDEARAVVEARAYDRLGRGRFDELGNRVVPVGKAAEQHHLL